MQRKLMTKELRQLIKLFLLVTITIATNRVFGQASSSFYDSIVIYAKVSKIAAKKNYKLWNCNLYRPIAFVNVTTKQALANYPDSAGELVKTGEIYTGQLYNIIAIANHSFDWNGRDCAKSYNFSISVNIWTYCELLKLYKR